ncbi:MAG: glycosyltransferase family 9 protein [Saprospiraceae bacterium]|nr:glycosyltransferase family 9 protein [Saprospiraceae bacterium]
MKVLIIRLSSIGDIILTSAAIKYAKLYLDAEVHYLTKKSNESLIRQNPYIDKVYLFDNDLNEIIKQLSEENYDRIFDLHNNLRSFIIKLKLKVKSSTLNKYNLSKWLMVNFKRKIIIPHIVKRYLRTIDKSYNTDFSDELEFYYPEIPSFIIQTEMPEEYYCFSLGAKHFTKKIPVSLAIRIIESINSKVVLIGGNDVLEESHEIEKKCSDKVINLCSKLSIQESAYIIEKSRLLVSSDTGMMHLGAALKKEVHVIWGNTVPEFGMYAYYGPNLSKSYNYEVDLTCRPCSKIGFDSCPKKHFRCMKDHDTEAIIKSISTSLSVVNR